MNEVANTDNWLQVENTEAERILISGACTVRLQRSTRSRQWQMLPLWILIGGLIGWASGDQQIFAGANSYSALATLAVFLMIQFWTYRVQLRRIAQASSPSYSLSIAPEGIAIDSALGHSRSPWSALDAIERRSDALLLHLKGFRALLIPERGFADASAFADFIAQLEQACGLKASASPVMPKAIPEKRGLSALRDFASNLRAGVLFALLRPSAPAHLRVSVLQIVLLITAGLLTGLAYDFATVGLKGQLYWYALPYQLFSLPCVLLCAWAVANCSPQPQRIPAAALAILAPNFVLASIVRLIFALFNQSAYASLLTPLGWLMLAWAGIAVMVALVRTLELPADQRLAAVLGAIFVFATPNLLDTSQARLWAPSYSENDDNSANNEWNRSAAEAVLYAQPALLEESLQAVRTGKPGVPELYLLALGGYGSQDVFKREVESVEALFAERFDTQNRSVVLINNPATVEERPMATTIALQRTLAEIGRKMNKEEDVLFLFMTSHGAEDHKFSLELWPYKFGELTPQSLRAQLDAAGIQNRVIVVSACYSGGFIEPLSDPHTLVMSASRADRNSHGCSHEADWTFFGKAYFDEALRGTRSFETAFASASAALATREATEGLTASEPQIAVGSAIRPILQAMERGLPPEAKGKVN